MQTNQFGRSMIEILGVLAIVGILSVGSIAGYQKAMMKYKLNKHAQSFNMLVSNALQISASINKAAKNGSDIYYNELLYKANLLPDGITYKNTAGFSGYAPQNHLLDTLGHEMSFYSRTKYGYNFALFTALSNTSYSPDICRNIINIAKEHSSNILYLSREDETYGGAYSSIKIYSDCKSGKCFQNLSLNDISNICGVSDNKKNDKGYYEFFIIW